jgi:hypothetical protein
MMARTSWRVTSNKDRTSVGPRQMRLVVRIEVHPEQPAFLYLEARDQQGDVIHTKL